jgi:hypothetical protein
MSFSNCVVKKVGAGGEITLEKITPISRLTHRKTFKDDIVNIFSQLFPLITTTESSG